MARQQRILCRGYEMKVLAVVLFSGILAVAQNPPSARPNEKQLYAETSPTRVDQGCVNQGRDRRGFAPVVCWMQRHMSWKSEHEPHFALIGKPDGTNVGLAWPPYLVFNSAAGNGHWRMFRIGFRYDRTWQGYIFPTVAAKHVLRPLRY
jgi:hypothetical protein